MHHRISSAITVISCLALPIPAAGAQGSQFALRFHGTGANQQDRVRIAIDDNVNGPDASTPCDVGGGSFTLEFWIRGSLVNNATASGGGDVETPTLAWLNGNIVLDRNVPGNEASFGVSIAGGFVRFGTGRGQLLTDNHDTIEGNFPVLNSQWHHVACVRDAATGVKRIYVDGLLDFESAAGASMGNLSYPNAGAPSHGLPYLPYLVLAAEKHDAGPSSPPFNGYLDELRVWNVARTQTQILDTYDRILTAGTPGLVGYYRFEEASGTAVADSSGSGMPAGVLVAGLPGNGEHVAYTANPMNTAPLSTGSLPAGFVKSTIATGLTEPTVLEALADGRLFVGERDGTIRVIQGGSLLPQPLVQLPADTTNGERGLMGLALDPAFAQNGYLYAFYTTLEPRDRVARLTVVGNTASLATEAVVWQGLAPASMYHHGGCIRFGLDGNLYISTGDQFAQNESQVTSTPYGKVLRVKPNGSVASGNPFAGQPGYDPNIWALGLRNPFRMSVDPLTGALWIGDVGGNTVSSYDEINLGAAGVNYGWPSQEASICYSGNCGGLTPPKFAYAHSDPEFAIGQPQGSVILGPVWRSAGFPAAYQGNLFFGDYANRWIRRAIVNGSQQIVATGLFERNPSAGTIVDLRLGADGALYTITIGTPWSGSPDVGAVHRIAYVGGGNAPPVAVASASTSQGAPPLAVGFSSAGTVDPDGGPQGLTYFWTFGDGATSTLANPSHTYTVGGVYDVTLTVSDGAAQSTAAPLAVKVGHPPVATILAPAANALYKAGDVIQFSGSAADVEDGILAPSAFSWQVLLVHESHSHPFLGPLTGMTQGSFTIPTTGHPPEHTHFEVHLTVTDSMGLTSEASAPLEPLTSILVLDTFPSGIPMFLDGAPESTPRVYESLVGYQHTLQAASSGFVGGKPYDFSYWLDGGGETQSLTMPIGSIHRTALYAVSGLQTSTVSVAASNRNAEHHPPTGQEYNNALDSRGICFGRNVAGELQAGFEFALPVPQGAVVTSASLTFTATLTQSGSPAATVRCYDVDDAPPFNSLSNISLTMYAPLTAAGVSWSPTAFTPDQIYTTPDLAPVLQEVVSRPGYASNHHVGFVFEGAPTSGAAWRCVKNYASGKPPVLTVTYTAPPPPPCGFTNYGYAGAPPAHNLGLTGSGCPRVNTTIGFVTSHVKSAGAWTLLCEGEGHMPFFDGFVLVDPNRYVLGDFVPSSNGTAMWNVSIPNDPHFVGYVLFGQSLAFDPSIPQGLAFSNGLTAVVCP